MSADRYTVPNIVWEDSCPSTSSLLLMREASLSHGAVVAARAQTAGRGQRGNSWEAEPGRNLTFSILLRPTTLEAARSFEMSMIVSLALLRTLQPLLEEKVSIKWPNDIYAGDRKLCGILIENAFCGTHIERSVVGIGVNVNQKEFRSDAPNPVSLTQLTGQSYDLDALLRDITSAILSDLADYEKAPDPQGLSERYRASLWRGTGAHDWLDCATGQVVHASIAHVALSGHLTLDTRPPRTYAFKEIAAIL